MGSVLQTLPPYWLRKEQDFRANLLLWRWGGVGRAGGCTLLPPAPPPPPRWALWFFKNDRSRAWQNNLHRVTKFNTVEDFWA